MARNNSDENNTPKQKPTRRSPRGKKGAQSEPTSSSNKPNQADNTPSFAQRMKAFFSRFTPSLTSVALTALVGAGVFFAGLAPVVAATAALCTFATVVAFSAARRSYAEQALNNRRKPAVEPAQETAESKEEKELDPEAKKALEEANKKVAEAKAKNDERNESYYTAGFKDENDWKSYVTSTVTHPLSSFPGTQASGHYQAGRKAAEEAAAKAAAEAAAAKAAEANKEDCCKGKKKTRAGA